jgi:3-phosphoshikimate 1-carboxyvinyltransferase
MIDGLKNLGFDIDADWKEHVLTVRGAGGFIPVSQASIDCQASGTTMRFLTALVSLGHGQYVLDGTTRMRQRPIGDLLSALRALGVDAEAGSAGECPPVTIHSRGIKKSETRIQGTKSSQFASGLALVAPCMPDGLLLELTGTLVSTPYLEMTRNIIESFGGTCEAREKNLWHILPTGYAARDFEVEPDASAASYFAAAAAITGGTVTLDGLCHTSMQGDIRFCEALEQMGCIVTWSSDTASYPFVTIEGRSLQGIDIDMNAISDTVMTLAVVALFAKGPTIIRNVEHIRDKETDRIRDLACELQRLGANVEEHPDGLTIHPAPLRPAKIQTYDDHRIAMSLSLAGLRSEGLCIINPACVGKTFPSYWTEFENLTKHSRN